MLEGWTYRPCGNLYLASARVNRSFTPSSLISSRVPGWWLRYFLNIRQTLYTSRCWQGATKSYVAGRAPTISYCRPMQEPLLNTLVPKAGHQSHTWLLSGHDVPSPTSANTFKLFRTYSRNLPYDVTVDLDRRPGIL